MLTLICIEEARYQAIVPNEQNIPYSCIALMLRKEALNTALIAFANASLGSPRVTKSISSAGRLKTTYNNRWLLTKSAEEIKSTACLKFSTIIFGLFSHLHLLTKILIEARKIDFFVLGIFYNIHLRYLYPCIPSKLKKSINIFRYIDFANDLHG